MVSSSLTLDVVVRPERTRSAVPTEPAPPLDRSADADRVDRDLRVTKALLLERGRLAAERITSSGIRMESGDGVLSADPDWRVVEEVAS